MSIGHTELLTWVAKGPRAEEDHKWRKASSSAKHNSYTQWWRWEITGVVISFKAWIWVSKKDRRALWTWWRKWGRERESKEIL
jgi:hypothetical protein